MKMYNAAIMMTVAIVLVIVFNDDPTALLIIVAMVSVDHLQRTIIYSLTNYIPIIYKTVLFQCLVTLIVLFLPKLYLSFLSKSSLIELLQEEKDNIQQEVR